MDSNLLGGGAAITVIVLVLTQAFNLAGEWQKDRIKRAGQRFDDAASASQRERDQLRQDRDALALAVKEQLADLRAEFAAFRVLAEKDQQEDRARIEELEGIVDGQRKTIRAQEDEIAGLRRQVRELGGRQQEGC